MSRGANYTIIDLAPPTGLKGHIRVYEHEVGIFYEEYQNTVTILNKIVDALIDATSCHHHLNWYAIDPECPICFETKLQVL